MYNKLSKYIRQLLIMFASLVLSRSIVGYLWYSANLQGKYQELDFIGYLIFSIINAGLVLIPFFIIFNFSTRRVYLKTLKDSNWFIIVSTTTYILTFVIFEGDYFKLTNMLLNLVNNTPTYLVILVTTNLAYYFLILLFYGFIYHLIKSKKKIKGYERVK